jgi:hypothetical protein
VKAIPERLRAYIARLDDATLVALANRGLLRRAHKDLESLTVEWDAKGGDSVEVILGVQRIQMDMRGIGQAHCSCPATGICQHILAAVVALQRQWAAVGVQEEITSPGSEELAVPEPNALLGELQQALLDYPAQALISHAGRAGFRWAWQYAQELDLEHEVRLSGERQVIIEFTRPRITFRFMGGAVENLVADVNLIPLERYQVAAVLAYQRAQGIELTPLPADKVASGRPAGEEHDQQLSRARLLSSVRTLLCDCLDLGLTHLSSAIQQRFEALSTWAQATGYHRLARLLHRQADHIQRLLYRSATADEHALFAEVCLTFGLSAALEQSLQAQAQAQAQAQTMHLIGQARKRYEAAGTLDMLGLGAYPWQTESGFTGLTMLFWCISHQTYVSYSDARTLQRGFDPLLRYRMAGPWTGLGTPEQATGRRIILTNAQVSEAGRLSAAASIRATVQEVSADILPGQLPVCQRWSTLQPSRPFQQKSLLAERDVTTQWAIVAPAAVEASYFDDTRQTLVWPVLDDMHQRLYLELQYNRYTAEAIRQLERLASHSWTPGPLLVVKYRYTSRGLVAEPITLIDSNKGNTTEAISSLYFKPGHNEVSPITTIPHQPHISSDRLIQLPGVLLEFRHWITCQVEKGIGASHGAIIAQQLDTWIERLKTLGLTTFYRDTQASIAANLMRAGYCIMQYEQVIVGNEGD